jgi:SAM-dependent methyltransferase
VTSAPVFQTSRRLDVRSAAPWSPFAYVGRKLQSAVLDLIARVDAAPGATILDYGCADSPYRSALSKTMEYVGADLTGNPAADVLLNKNGSVPLPASSFDVVLSTQVLEHVADPRAYVAECFRLLRPEGTLVLTTHGIMYYHRDPEDYWRWTCDGLTKIVNSVGFEVVEVRGVLGLAAAALQLFQDATAGHLHRWLRGPYLVLMQGLIALADRMYSEETRAQNGLVLAVRAVKPR